MVTVGAVMASAALFVSACSSSGSSSSSPTSGGSSAPSGGSSSSGSTLTASEKGVTPTTITVGLITPQTGLAQASYVGVVAAAKARIALQNAQGGVDGRQIKLDVLDDQSSPTGNAAASSNLASADVFGVLESSAFTFGGYKALQTAGVPVTGGPVDAGEWGVQPDTNMFNWQDPVDPANPEYTNLGKLMKDLGVTKPGGVSFNEEPAGASELTGMVASGAQLGLQKGYVNTSLTFGKLDASAEALALKQSGTDGLFLPIDAGESFQLLGAAKAAGVNLKAALLPSGYGKSLLDAPSAVAAAQGVYFVNTVTPVEIGTTATKAFQAALAKYAGFTGVPDTGYYWGWLDADLMIKGLQLAGANPTRKSFMDALHGVSNYDGGGLLATPADLTLANFGKPAAQVCVYAVQLEGKAFKPFPSNGSPVCGGPLSSGSSS